MLKKDIGTQIAVLLALGTVGLYNFSQDLNTSYPLLNTYFKTAQPTLIVISILCFIPPIINLFSYTISNRSSYDEKPFFMVLRAFIHLSFIGLFILNLAFFGAVLYARLIKISSIILAAIIVISLIYLIIHLVDHFLKKNLKISWYNPFKWIKKN